MRNKQDLINRYNNRHIDFDKAFGNQCFDVARQYFYDEGIKTYAGVGKAENIFYKKELFFRENLTFVKWTTNRTTNFPNVGSVIIWKATRNVIEGHVAIVIEANMYTFTVLEQNGYQNKKPCYLKKYSSYANVLGWFDIDYQKLNNNSENMILDNIKKQYIETLKNEGKEHLYPERLQVIEYALSTNNFSYLAQEQSWAWNDLKKAYQELEKVQKQKEEFEKKIKEKTASINTAFKSESKVDNRNTHETAQIAEIAKKEGNTTNQAILDKNFIFDWNKQYETLVKSGIFKYILAFLVIVIQDFLIKNYNIEIPVEHLGGFASIFGVSGFADTLLYMQKKMKEKSNN